ncbi:MAG: hypothetical protein LRS43_02780, partial [Desulfurococcales archaeon]|nr:hypothetical protein [Desulfurococcales archaeon]
MSLRPAFSFLIDLSGRVLRSAWNDLYFNDHTWSVEKAHRAALLALRAAAWRAGVESMADSLSHLAHLLSPACPRLSEIS